MKVRQQNKFAANSKEEAASLYEKLENLKRIIDCGIIAVVRAESADQALKIAEACKDLRAKLILRARWALLVAYFDTANCFPLRCVFGKIKHVEMLPSPITGGVVF